ncbi:hypothetical protein HPB52_015930 [Rhipicephalus sanguineus]|uniref:Sodium-dependent nutrient amino acid transporter 1 n=1 Tax=Rhipicephalus sanguineus TaxID=34632 RepID=A0A9D4PN71_RHISA|nr:hypothetical protein HPB52_015930 [Rhipicephalus sanguineus]
MLVTDVAPNDKESRDRPQWNKGLQFFLSCLSISIGLGNVWRFPTLAYQNGGGISVAQFVTSFYILVAYNYIMALCLFYLFASMQSPLPWTHCDPQWSDENCFHHSTFNATFNRTENATSSSEQFFRNYALKDSGEFKLPSAFDWRMALCLLLSWFIQGGSTIKGVHSIGKVWFNACEQSFFSLGIGMGVLTMYSSYNDFKHKVSRDAFFISIADTATSLLAGAVVFSTLGALAHQLGLQDISQVLKGTSDLGLAFVTYPEALSRISFVPQLWSVLFFFMLFLLGLGSGVSIIQLMVAVLEDQYPRLRELKGCTVLAICAVCFGTGLFLCTDNGNTMRLLFDNYGIGRALFLYAIFEVVGLVWVYGWKNICGDIGYMLGKPISWYWKITWGFLTPVSLIKFKATFTASEMFGPRDPDVKRDWLSWKASSRKSSLYPAERTASEHTNRAFEVD